MADDLPFLVKWKFDTDMKLREIMFMKRRILIAVTLLAVLSLMLPGSEAVADGESADQPILVTENQKFSVNITPDFNACYYTFTPQNNDLYAIEFEGDCEYYINEFTEDWYYVGGKYLQAGQDRYVFGELAKGTTINFLIFSYQDQPNITARISIVAPFSYVVLSDGTASITDVAVRGDIVIPSTIDGYTVTNLAEELFYGEEGITSVQVPATVTYFGSSKTNVDFDYVFSYCYDLESIIVDPANTAYKSVDGVLYTKDGSHLVNYPCAKAGVSYHTNAGVLSCTSFASCSYLKYLYLDNSETQWKGFTFYNTPELTTLYKPGGICERSAQQFAKSHEGEDGWCTFRMWDTNLIPDLKLPSQLTAIESEAFAGIRNVVIEVPAGVEQIGAEAFDESVTLYCMVGSAAEDYCKENGLNYIFK